MNPQPHIRNSPRTVRTILADKAGARLHSDVHTAYAYSADGRPAAALIRAGRGCDVKRLDL